MRHYTFLLAPLLLGPIWFFVRTWFAMRSHKRQQEPAAKPEPKVVEMKTPKQERKPAACGRYNRHLLLRLIGSEQNCRRCAAIEREREEDEKSAAVHEVEELLGGGKSEEDGSGWPPSTRES